MANTTKLALEASLKELLRTKPIDRITINDLTEHCGISRMTFYYHLRIFMIWWSGHVWRTESVRCKAKRHTIRGWRELRRYLRQYWKTSHLL